LQELHIPKSVSTFHKLKATAALEPWGKLRIGINKKEFLLVNKLYDDEKINYSRQYYTNPTLSSKFYDEDTEQIILEITKKLNINSIIEIGCGQGKLVRFLAKKNKKIQILGFDPIISKNSAYFKKGFYPSTINNQSADFYILQCVLPHINQPKSYIESIFAINKQAYIYVEFPNLKFILKNKLWYQFSYEHINYFTFDYFKKHFNIIKKGTYLGGEWSYVLIKNKKYPDKSNYISLYFYFIWCKLIIRMRKTDLKKIIKLTNNKTLFIFGAGGKGAMLAAHIHSQYKNIDIYMVDNDIKKHNLFLGSSAIKVISVQKALLLVTEHTFVIAANPNHRSYVSDIFSSRCTILEL
jgi:hypothetical protein